MSDAFSQANVGIESPALGAFVVTPNDAADLVEKVRSLTLNADGAVSYVGWDGVTYTTGILPQGTYPMLAQRIRATGTTATGITGWI